APKSGAASLDQYEIGPGALTVSVNTSTPGGLYNQSLGAGCGNPSAPTLYATGTPDRALLGNSTFALRSGSNPAGTLCAFLLSTAPGSVLVAPGCTAYTANPLAMLGPVVALADATGMATISLAVPNNPSLEGNDLDFQMLALVPGGPLFGTFNMSSGLRIRVGNLTTSCP
ncbi:MAG: hypothetical protein ABIP94_24365, partial [Planctomycetota bacterium]